MSQKYIKLFIVLPIYYFSFLFQGCNVINPKEKIPTYIHVDSFSFHRNSKVDNRISYGHQITTVWAYYNNNPIGQFDLPATIPVATDAQIGTGHLELAPGIAIDGLNSLLGIYDLYEYDTSTFIIQPGKIINYTPTTTYYDEVKYTPISDFTLRTYFGLAGGNVVIKQATDSGNTVGSITLNNVGDSSVDSSINYVPPAPGLGNGFVIPSGVAYIEFEYKSEIPFYVGLGSNLSTVISSTPYFLAGIKPSDHWQKFYLYVTDFAGQPATQGTSYTFYIKALWNSTEGNKGTMLIDNIQLISF